MCGIAGIVNFDGAPVERDLLKKMTDTLYHRGPDDEGYFINTSISSFGSKWKGTAGPGNVGLGHRRLSIIDVSSGHQPMASGDGRLWIVFNGEIYNFRALRAELLDKGHDFRTHSDTETIIYAYREWGLDCVSHLRGMFAFALWDDEKQQLLLARDRVGKKPLYYRWSGNQLLFGSELKSLLAYPGLSHEIDPQAVCDYFSLLYIPAPKSIYKGILKLPAAHIALFRQGRPPVTRQYWDLKFDPDFSVSEASWCEMIRAKLQECVQIRLESEVPLGAFLSGGIDSSAVVATMSKLMPSRVKTSSIGFQEQKFNELPYAREVVKLYDTDHKEAVVQAEIDVLDKLVWHYDEPFADSSAIPTYYVSKITRERVTVALSGDGGDENFAGYRRYYFDALENRLRGLLPNLFRTTLLADIARIYPKGDWMPRMFRGKTLLTNLSLSPVEAYFNSMSCFGAEKGRIFSPDFTRELNGYSSFEVFKHHFQAADTDDPLARIQYLDMKTYLVEDVLAKVDRASMANSLEVRVPLLDHEFMELVARIPTPLKLKGREGKYIFKKALEPLVSSNILYRPKMGFSIPLRQWLNQEFKINGEVPVNSREPDYLNPHFMRSMVEKNRSGVRDFSTELWACLVFRKWLQSVGY